jgi:hypothetical protein
MGAWFAAEFCLLAVLSTWMTASAILALKGNRQRHEEMNELYEQVVSSVRSGDLPRAILLLEGEPGPLAALLSSILTEATKFTPKLRVAYKITLESLKRRSQVTMNPLRAVSLMAPAVGVIGFVVPIWALLADGRPAWTHHVALLILASILGAIAHFCLVIAERQDRDSLLIAGELGRKLLNFLLGSESPLPALRGRGFPPVQ